MRIPRWSSAPVESKNAPPTNPASSGGLIYGIGVADVFVDILIEFAFGTTTVLAVGATASDRIDFVFACVETRLLFTVLLFDTVGFGIGVPAVEGIPFEFAVEVLKLLLLLLDVRS